MVSVSRANWVVKVCHRIKTAGMAAADFPGRMANILAGHQIRRTKDVGQADQDKVLQALGHALTECHGFSTVFFSDAAQIVGYGSNGLFPGYFCPFAGSAFPHPLQGLGESVRVGEALCGSQALGADIALVEVSVRIPFNRRILLSEIWARSPQPP